MSTFDLHPQLAADTLFLADWPLSRVLRMNDRTYPWLILVPRIGGIREIIDLEASEQQILMQEIARASEALKRLRRPHKINVAALGNMVPQLHVHVVARTKTDLAWRIASPFGSSSRHLVSFGNAPIRRVTGIIT